MSDSASIEETIFNAARRFSEPEKRAAYLELACGKDRALRERIERLLESDELLAEGCGKWKSASPEILASLTEAPGTVVGRYKLLQKIGEGGCGVVYMAEQEKPIRRRVALKVIKLGMDTRQVVARFEVERQALALMDHPNIAKVFDAGATDTGRPYFVMELVRGIKITEYCDQNNLSIGERLALFVKVAHAIEHAHQKGVIHRDIKPSNILVTLQDGGPAPKVIDFGIAKATEQKLTDMTLVTEFEQFVGTPAYTSPEQAEMSGLDIDTRTDIYSLGVLLYELLVGRTPFDSRELLQSGLNEMRRIIREEEPVRPSTRLSTMVNADRTTSAQHRRTSPPQLISLLRADLDWIVMKCLEKDRTRRYDTAKGLASDVQRHMNHEPVLASPPSQLYRLQKLVRRKRLIITAATAVALALLIGFAGSRYFLSAKASGIDIASEPSGAQVWMGDKRVGVTPFRLSGPAARQVDVALRLPDYEPVQTTMELTPSVQQKLIVVLKKIDAQLAGALPAGVTRATNLNLAPLVSGAVIIEISGTVDVRRKGSTIWNRAELKQLLFAGDTVRTGQRSILLTRMPDGTMFRLSELSTMILGDLRTPHAKILIKG